MLNKQHDTLDAQLWDYILQDIKSGTLYLESDDETLQLILQDIYGSRTQYSKMGVIFGLA
jgi:hypothetical protein